LVTLLRIYRQLTNGRLSPLRLKTRHFRNGMPAELRTFIGVDIEFGANADEIWFPRPIALLPVVGRDEYLNELLRRYAEEALARKPQARPTVRSQAEDVLSKLLPHGRATASEVARKLAMSSRTLSRKLGEEGTSIGEVLDELRAALAKRYLHDATLPVSEIAWLLGYREVSSLTHAFKRWTGTTPRRFRSGQLRAS
jgi:AraC-like DNA-binding protein